MKKILAVVLSLAMILGMTVSTLAAAPLPTNGEAQWVEYFTEVYTNESLDAEAQANALAISVTMTNDVNMLLRALNKAIENAEALGVDTTETNIALSNILAEYGLNLEQGLGEDIDGDGYLGDPENGGVIYVPTDPDDVEAWTLYYTIILSETSSEPAAIAEVIGSIAGDVMNGKISMETFTEAFPAAATATGGDTVNQILWGVETLLNADLNSDGEIGEPDGSMDDVELPEEDEETGDDTDFLNTILGILGSIGDMIFGGGSDDPSDEEPSDEEPWDDENNLDDGDEDELVSDTGDTTVISVVAVALVAGAALVLTRKKSEDAE